MNTQGSQLHEGNVRGLCRIEIFLDRERRNTVDEIAYIMIMNNR